LVTRAGRRIVLGTRAFAILVLLLRNPGRVFSRAEIVEHVWGTHERLTVVDSHIRELRAKIDEPFAAKLIHTERRVGYGLAVVKAD
jgi:two-component system copper resistance phosphate regulon response regulator CusR